ncbi:hypothetical protein M885DRAFT_501262 [Pelagophyceae sp. CCMP2097]|nr:hypothetical protein M885DRAFT_501262 [Pelagophyceae sp. CCMP2097]
MSLPGISPVKRPQAALRSERQTNPYGRSAALPSSPNSEASSRLASQAGLSRDAASSRDDASFLTRSSTAPAGLRRVRPGAAGDAETTDGADTAASSARTAASAGTAASTASSRAERHPQKWVKREFKAGKCVGGGCFPCCGARERLSAACGPAARADWDAEALALDAHQAAEACRRAMHAQRKRQWAALPAPDVPIRRVTTAPAASTRQSAELAAAASGPSGADHTFSSTRPFAEGDVPMLVRTFRDADSEWVLEECLHAAQTLCGAPRGRMQLLRHGFDAAVLAKLRASARSARRRACGETPRTPDEPRTPHFSDATPRTPHFSDETPRTLHGAGGTPRPMASTGGSNVLSAAVQRRCIGVMAAFARCQTCKGALAVDPDVGLVFAQLLGAFRQRVRKTPRRRATRVAVVVEDPFCVLGDASAVVSAATVARATQRAFFGRAFFDEDGDRFGVAPPAVVGVIDAARAGLARARDAPTPDEAETALRLVEAAFEAVDHLGALCEAARSALRENGAIELSFAVVEGARAVVARSPPASAAAQAATDALSAAVATLRRVAVVRGRADARVAAALPAVVDALRAELGRGRIQLQGFQLIDAVAGTAAGAQALDGQKGAWHWLGQASGRPANGWCAADGPVAPVDDAAGRTWTPTEFVAFAGLRPPAQADSDALRDALDQLRIAALLPFEAEKADEWRRRMRAFEKRNKVKFLNHMIETGTARNV